MNLSKVIIAPDSFKGALTAREAADIIADEVRKAFPDCEIIKMPIADGGEGSVDAVLSATGGRVMSATVLSPDFRQIDATFGIADNGTAIIEMAQSSGITRQLKLNPMTSDTRGFGELVLAALDEGVRAFTLCIGGSATTDGGCGMAAALGVKFFGRTVGQGDGSSVFAGQGDGSSVFGTELSSCFTPCGETLCNIDFIDMSGIDKRVSESVFTVMCDVDNPLYGERGAAYVYGPQKGANPEQVRILDDGLRHYGAVLQKTFGRSFDDKTRGKASQRGSEDSVPVPLSCIPGAGAAGGLGAGCMAFLNATLKSGIDTILELYDFRLHVKDADLLITGEGKLDSQSFQGKVLSGILRESGNVPVTVICGVCDCDPAILKEKGITVFETSEGITIKESMEEPVKYLRIAAQKAMRKEQDR
ncbi:MAG: glycerate kinase [Oscillospiraceae bacterium]|nr:glycerate kinase [Oscillospiraceae bacterium]